MSLWLPDNIPVAAQSLAALEAKGAPQKIPGFSLSRALVLITDDEIDSVIVWAAPSLRSYRAVWNAAHRVNLVDDLSEWGDDVDVDHVYPKSWAKRHGPEIAYVRLFPAWAEVNRSAGASREKADTTKPLIIEGIVFATELQVLKIIGHPVGTESDPESIFEIETKKE
jgi:hypothetical protein